MDSLNDFTSVVRRGVDDWGMIDEGDTVTVGLSGGKDSLVLLCALNHLKTYYPKRFFLRAITLDIGFPGMDFAPVTALCERLEVPYTIIKSDIREIVFDIRREENPCSLCSKMRRGALNAALRDLGSNKLALGHHADDAIETFLMSLLFEGRVSCFKPITYMSRAEVYQIRPMIYADEARVERLCDALELPVVVSTCPEDKHSKRQEIKTLIRELEKTYPDLRAKIFGAMKRLPLDGWETKDEG